jgi:hypothetical protein
LLCEFHLEQYWLDTDPNFNGIKDKLYHFSENGPSWNRLVYNITYGLDHDKTYNVYLKDVTTWFKFNELKRKIMHDYMK